MVPFCNSNSKTLHNHRTGNYIGLGTLLFGCVPVKAILEGLEHKGRAGHQRDEPPDKVRPFQSIE